MPSRNVIKLDAPDSYFHIYARGSNKQVIFQDDSDYSYFLHLLERYLSPKAATNRYGYAYPSYAKDLKLLAFCLMPNHIHLLVYQEKEGIKTALMRSLMTSYSRYYNLKYKRTGPLFESRYKASMISQQDYLEHISRYIHLNPRSWRRYPFSSLMYYLDKPAPAWLQPESIKDLFANKQAYLTFVMDYVEHKDMLDTIKHELADR